MAQTKGEKLVEETNTKKIYNYEDNEKGIKVLSREVYKNEDLIIHYPRGFEGDSKYKTIKKFSFYGFKGKLPKGVYKSVNFGYGFTQPLKPFSNFFNENYSIQEVKIVKGGKIEIDNKNNILYLNELSLSNLLNTFNSIYKKNNAEVEFVLKVNLHNIFPSEISKPDNTYIQNALAISLSSWGNSIEEFSSDDKNAIKDLFDKLSLGTDFLTKDALAKTKEIIDIKYIKETIKKYKELIALKTGGENLEKQWQVFLKDNSWIFSSIFAQPVILFKDEAYVGGKTLDNQNGKFSDFLIKNSLSNNISFLEIKTHKTKILEDNPYRGKDVYCASKELVGCIIQVLDQRDNFQKDFYSAKVKSDNNFETLNSKCVVLIGSVDLLNKGQKKSFELFRSNSRDVELLTFDELLLKIESLQSIMENP